VNVYLVKTKDEREYVEPIMDDGTGPSFTCWPMAPVVAETPGRAKSLFLAEFAQGSRTGVYSDDFPNLRVKTLARDVDLPVGVREDDDELWALILDDPGAGASGGEREQFVAASGEGVGASSPRSRKLAR
jgi:hypothetical protein